MDKIDKLLEEAYQQNIHPVCLLCKHECKQPYEFWSFQMPPTEFCSLFEEKEQAVENEEVD